MSDSGRTQFAGPEPGLPIGSGGDAAHAISAGGAPSKLPTPGPQDPALPAFCLVLLAVMHVDYLKLSDNYREVFERDEQGEWRGTPVNA